MKVLFSFILIILAPITWSEAKKVTGICDPWPVLMDPHAEKQGLVIEVAREALQSEGMTLEVDFVPWTRAMAMIKQNRADILVGAWFTDARNEYLLYSKPLFASAVKFIKRTSSNFQYSSMNDLDGLRVGTIDSYHYSQAFLTQKSIERIPADSLLVNIQNLIAGRIDLVLDDQFVLRHTLNKHIHDWPKSIQFVDQALAEKKIYLATNRSNPDSEAIIAAFDAGLKKLKKSGRYQEIIDSYSLKK
jgi:polar amino acid transport system substrate-binding protein